PPVNDDDAARFETLYRQTYDRITAYAVRRCDSAQDAADIVADTFTVAWRRISELPPGDEARLWLYGVARNLIADQRRSALRRQARHVELAADLAGLYGDHAEAAIERDPVTQALRSIPDSDRELLLLVAWEGLTREEISVMLGLSSNAVRIRLHRARR